MTRRQVMTILNAGGPALLGLAPLHAAKPEAADRAPKLSVHEAIELAEGYVKEKKVAVEGMHLASAVYQPEAEQPHWAVTWKTNTKVKGGWFAIHVRPDKSTEAKYGE